MGNKLNLVIAILSVIALPAFVLSVYNQVTAGVSATLEKEQREREQRKLRRRRESAKLSNG
jgi:Tfp pilus assembly protein PilE